MLNDIDVKVNAISKTCQNMEYVCGTYCSFCYTGILYIAYTTLSTLRRALLLAFHAAALLLYRSVSARQPVYIGLNQSLFQ